MLARHIWSRVHAPTCRANWIIFICLQITLSTIFIRFPDKDVTILLLHFIQNLAHMILFGIQEQVTRHFINVKKSCKLKEMTFVTFCLQYTLSQVATQTRAFVGKGETTNLLISLVSLMFSVSWKIFWYATSHLEHFVCMLYNYRYGIQPLRYERFASGKACRKIHPKTRKLISAFYHHAEMHLTCTRELITNPHPTTDLVSGT